jgi:hypothetical protein
MSGATAMEYPLCSNDILDDLDLSAGCETTDFELLESCVSDSNSTLSQSESTCSIDSMSDDDDCTPAIETGSSSRDCVIIFDWDDTLLPSSWLTAEGLRLDSPASISTHHMQELQVLESAVIRMLKRAVNFGDVIIITNAETGWVELSSRRFFPRVPQLLRQLGIRILSARSTFESRIPDHPFAWKVAAFDQEISDWIRATSPCRTQGDKMHIISFGDSVHERDAVHQIAGPMVSAYTKSIKFVERPNTEQLRRQVELVQSCLDYISNYQGDLDLMLTIQLLYNK